MRFAVAALLILLASFGAAASVAADSDTPRFLALGDSYTIGEGVRGRERWPVQLTAALASEGIVVDTPEIVATTGWTTSDLRRALDDARPRPPFSLVTLMIGVNDQFQGRSLEDYRKQLQSLLERAATLAGCDAGRVVVVSIPDWGVTPFAGSRDRTRIAAEIDRFNDACRNETAAAGARWVDVTPASRRAVTRPDLIAGDGLHPSAAMYAEWVKLILPAAMQALREGKPPHCAAP